MDCEAWAAAVGVLGEEARGLCHQAVTQFGSSCEGRGSLASERAS